MRTPAARRLARVLRDLSSWLLATVAVVGSRYDFRLNEVLWGTVALYAVLACVAQIAFGTIGMLYRSRYRIATFEECVGLAITTTLAGATLALGFLTHPTGYLPACARPPTCPVALLSMAAGRLAFRALRERVIPHPDAEKVLIYGAGDAGYQLVHAGGYHRPRPADRSERRAMIQAFHAGAYRYWVQHDAPPRWHPWRWIKAFLLTTQGQLATVTAEDVP